MQEELDKSENMDRGDQMTRKEALYKAGKYAAFTAAAMMAILDPAHAKRQPPKSPPKPPGGTNRDKEATSRSNPIRGRGA